MQLISAPRPARQLGAVVSGTLVGAILVAVGLGLAFLVIATPFVTRLVQWTRAGSSPLEIALGIGVLAVVAGTALSIAGTNRLAATLAAVRHRSARQSPVVRVLSRLSDEIVVATDVVPSEGRPIPELVVGPFGVAVVHELGPRDVIRPVGRSWELRTRDGWVPTEYPLDRVVRDAERVRNWLGHGDLDFVVRVYGALVTSDEAIVRSPLCAVIRPDQIPSWIEALPRQRSLTAGRRHHLLARIRAGVEPASR